MPGLSIISGNESIYFADNLSLDGTERDGALTTNGQLWIGSTAAPHVKKGTITSPGGSITVGYSAGNITLETAGGAGILTLTGDTGGALSPTANNINILGGPGITVTGTGSTLTVNSVVFTDVTASTLTVDSGFFATAAGTYDLPATAAQGELIHIVADTAGAVVVDAPAGDFIRIGSAISADGGTATSTAQGDSLTLRFRSSSQTWVATSVIGNWILT